MEHKFTFRQMAAVAALSAAAGFFTPKNCHPMVEERREEMDSCTVASQLDPSVQMLSLIARRSVRMSALTIRSEAGAGAETAMDVHFDMLISPAGQVAFLQADISCGGKSCPMQTEVPAIIGVLMAQDWTVEPRSRTCTIEIDVPVPPVRREPAWNAPDTRLQLEGVEL